ncbi:MAG TPA: hypothetical protein VN066_09725 [Rhodocyclaceae bacterium]|nr:hypothetical protein [Rhodocyclaceae bacterium]
MSVEHALHKVRLGWRSPHLGQSISSAVAACTTIAAAAAGIGEALGGTEGMGCGSAAKGAE